MKLPAALSLTGQAAPEGHSRMRQKQIKQHGIHYTPTELAGFLAEMIVREFAAPRTEIHVLDPACGDGSLLLAILDAIPEQLRSSLHLHGFEMDEAAVEAARSRLSDAPSVTIEKNDFLAIEGVIPQHRSLFDERDEPTRKYDIIISNPPYVRTQVLGAKRAQELAKAFGLTGRVDLSYAFAKAMSNLLKPGGVLGLLTSNRFMTIKAGDSLRRLFRHEFRLHRIFDLGDTKLFGAAVLPAIIIAEKRKGSSDSEPSQFSRIYECRTDDGQQDHSASSVLEALRDDSVSGMIRTPTGMYRLERGTLNNDDGAVWSLSTAEYASVLGKIHSARACTFEDVSHIRVGVKSTADEVFIRKEWKEEPRIEVELIHPLITFKDVKRWRIDWENPTRHILYPHTNDKNGKRKPIRLADYPGAAAYFAKHEDRLRRRHYVTDAGREWYEVWVPHNPTDWAKPKLVFPDITETPRCSLDLSGALVSGECYWITLRDGQDEDWLYLMLAVANSTFIEHYYDLAFHNKLYAGRRRFQTQFVKAFPLPDMTNPHAKRLIQVVKDIVYSEEPTSTQSDKSDELVWQSFGLSKHAVRQGNL